jgi:hypothetical protein
MRSVIRSSRVLALVILAACGGRSAKSSPSPDGQAMLQTGNSTESFMLPAYLVRTGGPLRFVADPIGGDRTPVSEGMTVPTLHEGENHDSIE